MYIRTPIPMQQTLHKQNIPLIKKEIPFKNKKQGAGGRKERKRNRCRRKEVKNLCYITFRVTRSFATVQFAPRSPIGRSGAHRGEIWESRCDFH